VFFSVKTADNCFQCAATSADVCYLKAPRRSLLVRLWVSILRFLSELWFKQGVKILVALRISRALAQGSQVFPRPAVDVERGREGPLATSQRGEESICGGIWQQSDGFPVEVGWRGRRSPVPPEASGIPQREAGRSGQRRLLKVEWMSV